MERWRALVFFQRSRARAEAAAFFWGFLATVPIIIRAHAGAQDSKTAPLTMRAHAS